MTGTPAEKDRQRGAAARRLRQLLPDGDTASRTASPKWETTLDSFESLELVHPLQRAVTAEGYKTMTPIQAQAIPPLLDGYDVLGCAQTGTGKTAAFLLPILDTIAREPARGRRTIRALILAPTRELAAQIGDNFRSYSRYLKVFYQVIFGGVSQRPQVSALQRGVDVLIATPGRLLDLHNQGFIDFDDVEFFVLDEADQMLDMGFIHDIRRILKLLPEEKQSLLFSATMPTSIVKLAKGFMYDPVRVEVAPQATTADRVVQHVMYVSKADKKPLIRQVLSANDMESAIVFTRTKHGADRVVKLLLKADINAAAIHGNKSQNARQRALAAFKDRKINVLVATDIASRGIDVDGVSHVINYDLPNIPESYVHRIGRTARAGREGIAISFCDGGEVSYLRAIQRLTGEKLNVIDDHEWHPADLDAHEEAEPSRAGQRGGRGRAGGQSKQRGGGRPSNRGGRGSGNKSGNRTSNNSGKRSSERQEGGQGKPQKKRTGASSPSGSGGGNRSRNRPTTPSGKRGNSSSRRSNKGPKGPRGNGRNRG